MPISISICICAVLTSFRPLQWKEYLRRAALQEGSDANHEEVVAAGTSCHRESAFLQEVAMEAAMSERQNIWIDGSLSNGSWFSMVCSMPARHVCWYI